MGTTSKLSVLCIFSIRKVYRVIHVGEKMGIVRAIICLFVLH